MKSSHVIFPVSTGNLAFLKQTEEEALLNVQKLNPRLYEHITDINEIFVSIYYSNVTLF